MSAELREEWLTIPEAYPLLRRHFRTQAALRHHLWKRDTNGLAAMGAVRKSPLGMLLVNVERVTQWARGEDAPKAA